MSQHTTPTAKIFLLIISLFPLYIYIYIYIYNCFLSIPPPPYTPQPPAPVRQTLTRASGHVCSVLACQLQGMAQLSPCVQCTHLRYTSSLAHAWHGKTQMRELKRYIEQVPLSFTLPLAQKQTLNTWIFLASPPNQCVTPLDCPVFVFHGVFEPTRTVAVWLSWPLYLRQ